MNHDKNFEDCDNLRYSYLFINHNKWRWTTDECRVEVAVKSNGLIGLSHIINPCVYNNGTNNCIVRSQTAPHVSIINENGYKDYLTTLDYFSVIWEKDAVGEEVFPSAEDNECGHGSCVSHEEFGEIMCLCNITVYEDLVFNKMPTRYQMKKNLFIGAFSPDLFDENVYVSFSKKNGVEAFRYNGFGNFSIHTIFKVENEVGQTIFMKNSYSSVRVSFFF